MSHRFHITARVAIVPIACLFAWAPAANAGVYRCTNGGATYVSDRPCVTTKIEEKFTAMGPRAGVDNSYRSQNSNVPSIGQAPEHLKYMSTTCAQLNDAIRTAPARGLHYDVISQLHKEYQSKCSEEDNEARRAVSNDHAQERQEHRSEMQAQQASKNDKQRERERCDEMLRILHNKRSQFDSMSEGQKADFQNFQSNYNARCKNG